MARAIGKQELKDWSYVYSSKGLGNGRNGNPVVYGLGILACGAGF